MRFKGRIGGGLLLTLAAVSAGVGHACVSADRVFVPGQGGAGPGPGAGGSTSAANGGNTMSSSSSSSSSNSSSSASSASSSMSASSSSSGAGGCTMDDGGSGVPCDRSWAQWKVTPSAFVDNGDGTILDTTTQLLWQKASTANLTWQGAATTCASLSLAGHCDWRVPTRIELSTIVDDTATTSPLIKPIFDADETGYWTSSPRAGSSGSEAWALDFNTGIDVDNVPVATPFDVRCVR